jgi:hypothetical protein
MKRSIIEIETEISFLKVFANLISCSVIFILALWMILEINGVMK